MDCDIVKRFVAHAQTDGIMDVKTLRLILLLAKADLVKPLKVAKAAGVKSVTVYRWIIWRRRPLRMSSINTLLGAAGASREDLERPVSVTPKQLAAAARWFRLDVSEDEIRAAAGDVPGLAALFDGGRLKARR